jgi:hypothetical protein
VLMSNSERLIFARLCRTLEHIADNLEILIELIEEERDGHDAGSEGEEDRT